MFDLERAGVGRGRTECLPSSLEGIHQSHENTFRPIRADLGTSEANSVRVLLTADGGTVGESNIERFPYIGRRGARRGFVQGVSVASRVTIWAGKEHVAATCVKAHCYWVSFDHSDPSVFKQSLAGKGHWGGSDCDGTIPEMGIVIDEFDTTALPS